MTMAPNHITESNVYDLTSNFALRIVKLNQYLTEEKKEWVISKQLLRSGTSIGANTFEGKNAYSRDDFAFKNGHRTQRSRRNGILDRFFT